MPLLGSMRGSLNLGQTNELANYKDAIMLFVQTNAPLNWTKSTSFNDYTLRVAGVGESVSSGGMVNFSESVFASNVSFSQSVSFSPSTSLSTGVTTLSIQNLPSHTHNFPSTFATNYPIEPAAVATTDKTLRTLADSFTETIGRPILGEPLDGHAHSKNSISFSNNLSYSLNFRVKYVDCIIATFNY
jgi:hypothetical protein